MQALRSTSAQLLARRQLVFAGGGALTVVLYLVVFTLRYPLLRYNTTPLLNFGGAHVAGDPYVLTAGWLALFALYYACYRLCPPATPRVVLVIVGVAVVSSVLLLLMYPMGSTDLYAYVARGHYVVTYHANPFTVQADQYPKDPFSPFVYWKSEPDNYGVLWHFQTDLLSQVVGSGLLRSVLAYKALVIAYFWAGFPVVVATLRRLRPDYVAKGLLLYAWNPLIQLTLAANAHNDALVVFTLLLGVFFLVRRNYAASLFSVGCGFLVKFVPALMVPVILITLARDRSLTRTRKLGAVLAGGAAWAVLTVMLFAPFGIETAIRSLTNLHTRAGLFANSVGALVVWILSIPLHVSQPLAVRVIETVALVVTANLVAVLWLRLGRGEATTREVLIDHAITSANQSYWVLLLVGSLWLWPWYLTWLLAFLPFVRARAAVERTVLLTGCALIVYLAYYFVGRYVIQRQDDQTALTLVIVAFLYLPVLLFEAGRRLRERQSAVVRDLQPSYTRG